MSKADTYRAKAAEFLSLALTEKHPTRVVELQNLARQYMRLAEQASRNSGIDVAYELPDQPPPRILKDGE
jgi:hypothetical protein